MSKKNVTKQKGQEVVKILLWRVSELVDCSLLKNIVTMIKSGKISKDITRMSETRNVYKTSVEKLGNRENDGKILVYPEHMF